MKRVDVADVHKRFQLRRERAKSLREAIPGLLSRARSTEDLWALKGVSFEVHAGDAVGIIGRNGSGKSTMLKLLSGIMRPTRGAVAVDGRTGALIELGAGFHPEFTGRENVFLNGSILGMLRSEIKEKFDRIVEFAELGRFMEMPVKHYSSGMHMRLGFSIAIHSEPDVLLIDEVLAVGDEAFQQKCLGRIEELRDSGRAIVLVSHNLDQVARLCNRAIWLDEGTIQSIGPASEVVESYVQGASRRSQASAGAGARGGSPIEITSVRLLDGRGRPARVFGTGDRMVVEVSYLAHGQVDSPVFGVAIHRGDGLYCFGTNTQVDGLQLPDLSGAGTVSLAYDPLQLLGGSYTIDVAVFDAGGERPHHQLARVSQFEVARLGGHQGAIMLGHEWNITQGDQEQMPG